MKKFGTIALISANNPGQLLADLSPDEQKNNFSASYVGFAKKLRNKKFTT
ncbi:hypothetical protein PIPA1_22820 [Pelosinus sp. IPA-1]|nr:hypothetical protein PIPA1_22820 [Pelosinus sp. IPA-1]